MLTKEQLNALATAMVLANGLEATKANLTKQLAEIAPKSDAEKIALCKLHNIELPKEESTEQDDLDGAKWVPVRLISYANADSGHVVINGTISTYIKTVRELGLTPAFNMTAVSHPISILIKKSERVYNGVKKDSNLALYDILQVDIKPNHPLFMLVAQSMIEDAREFTTAVASAKAGKSSNGIGARAIEANEPF